MIIVKMKEGKSAEPIATKYAHSLKPNIEETKLSKTVVFDCILNTSYEVLQLAEEINQRDDVEWAEPDMWIPFHTYSRDHQGTVPYIPLPSLFIFFSKQP